MNTKPIVSILSIFLFSLCVIEVSLGQPSLPVKPTAMTKELQRIRTTILAWLECIDCLDGQLQSVVALGETAVPHLIAALLLGPSPASRYEMSQHLARSYQSLKQRAATHPNFQFKSNQQEYVDDYMDNYIATYRIRSSIALGKIGGGEAEEALRTATTFFRPDVEREVRRSLAIIQGKPVP